MACVKCDSAGAICEHPMRMGEDCPEGDLSDCETCNYAMPCPLCCVSPTGDHDSRSEASGGEDE